MLKGRKGNHNIQLQKNCNHQEDQRATFHTPVAGENFFPLQGSARTLLASVLRDILNLFLNSESSSALRDKQCFPFGF